ncbi:hypothetical protein [Kaistella polysaccharea]|uniref:hypothetical protein n=1 Tax=Kaistella polysaccharea TaxID=2878534 RepID=UPI001CF1B6A0|nr:hypothetical protein [Kaistella polysaccharea]
MSPTNPLLKFTQYYKAEKECPKSCANSNFWEYEKMWVENEEERAEDHPRVLEYKRYVLHFYNEEDGIPLSLKALLYNRYSHWTGGRALEDDVRGFKEFLQENYLRKM